MLCPQFCGTDIYWDKERNCYCNTRNKERHECPIAERAKEFMGIYNMIQIKTIRPHLEKIQEELNTLNSRITYVETKINKKEAEKFKKRKQLGNKRNYQA